MSTGRLSPSKSALQLLAAGDGRGHRVVLGGIGAMLGVESVERCGLGREWPLIINEPGVQQPASGIHIWCIPGDLDGPLQCGLI